MNIKFSLGVVSHPSQLEGDGAALASVDVDDVDGVREAKK
jgi:hypothetical protein